MNEEIREEIRKAQEAVDEYAAILVRYGHGRWANMGKRELERRKEDLRDIMNKWCGSKDGSTAAVS